MTLDVLRLEVAQLVFPRGPVPNRFQLLVHVNDVEITSAANYLGVDPFPLFHPVNQLAATTAPHTTSLSLCLGCAISDCCDGKATITRDGDLVHWDWGRWPLMPRRATFHASQYDAEVARCASDHSWENPADTAGRLVVTLSDRSHLDSYNLAFDYVDQSVYHGDLFHVALIGDGYQVFLDFPWQGRSPTDLAADVCATLALPPQQWDATWFPNHWELRESGEAPDTAGPGWRRLKV